MTKLICRIKRGPNGFFTGRVLVIIDDVFDYYVETAIERLTRLDAMDDARALKAEIMLTEHIDGVGVWA